MASDSKGEEKRRMEVERGADREVGLRKGGWWREREMVAWCCRCVREGGKQGGGGRVCRSDATPVM